MSQKRPSIWGFNLGELADMLREVATVIEWQRELAEDFHLYCHAYGFPAGSNVYLNVLTDALRHRGMTLEQFRESERVKR